MFQLFKTTIIGSSLLEGAVDNHSHVLYGVDDGVSDIKESMTILQWLEKKGLKELWLTPHIMEDVPNTTDGLKLRFQELQAAYSGNIKLHLAAEYMMDNLYSKRLKERDLLEHGEGVVLLETSALMPPLDFWELLQQTMSAGYRPLLAHPERYRYMSPDDYVRLHNMGVWFQLNLPSITGFYGKDVQARAENLLKRGWYCVAGSDCHRFSRLYRTYTKLKISRKTACLLSDLQTKNILDQI